MSGLLSNQARPVAASQRLSRSVLVVSALVTVALYAIPEARILSYPLVLLSTLAHELGHGLTAVLVGGQFSSFELYADASGVALTGTGGRLQEVAVLAGGLIGPSIAAVLLFVMGRTPDRARTCLWLIAALLTAALLLVVRNLFGWFFIGGLATFCALVAWRGPELLSQLVIVFGGTQLALSVYSRGDYLFTPVAATSAGDMPSDVAQLSAALLLPYWFWGALCGAISVAVVLFGVKYYWRS
jgi:hypothetical protein